MKTIDVCLSPELLHLYDTGDCTVVVADILRATSCMVTAFAHGVDHIIPFADAAKCREMKAQGYITAGERNGERMEGFDRGNSPFEYMGLQVKGHKIAFTTTNGTLAIERSRGAREVVIGSFLNLSAVADHVATGKHRVLVVCAAWKGQVNLEDTLFAGALVDKLTGYVESDGDAALLSRHLFLKASENMAGFLDNSSHVRRLKRLNIQKDIDYCLQVDQYAVVPRFLENVLKL